MVTVVIAAKFKKHGRTDATQEAFSFTNATKSAKMHFRGGYPICKYISPRPILPFSLNNNTNIPVCVCYDFRVVSILLARSKLANVTVPRMFSRLSVHQPSIKAATSRNMIINSPAFIPGSDVFIKSNAHANYFIFSQAVSIL